MANARASATGGIQGSQTTKGAKRAAADDAPGPSPPSKYFKGGDDLDLAELSFSALMRSSKPHPVPVKPAHSPGELAKDLVLQCYVDAFDRWYGQPKGSRVPASERNPRRSPGGQFSQTALPSVSGSGLTSISAPLNDTRQPSVAIAGRVLDRNEDAEIAKLQAIAARHRAIAASIEKTIAELKKPCAP
ncbi:hypothetical protein EWM64_g10142 [Hericium alpestre]|uniref:Uncharacterized protein n=1 Tax=Hericium alpestre TaxID=135208 RepID=A0A4Y9ZI57_9AGAM|nr:hypothetical protein EWM64_g10142 [Hericium alpestre]